MVIVSSQKVHQSKPSNGKPSIVKSFQYLQRFCLPDRYQMVINVNITCLLALASVYMGVATSLPSTANIKPVEFYLIYNLVYPFLPILLAVYIQVQDRHQHSLGP